jgi:hypothetical protein
MDLEEVCFGYRRRMEMTQDHVTWRALVLVVSNLKFLFVSKMLQWRALMNDTEPLGSIKGTTFLE